MPSHHPALDQTSVPEALLLTLPTWLRSAPPHLQRDVAQTLRARHLSESPYPTLATLEDIMAFARSRLAVALSARFGGLLHPERDHLSHVDRYLEIPGRYPAVSPVQKTVPRRTSLLAAAMQNFEADAARPDWSLERAGQRFEAYQPSEFVSFCRGLDLGAQYQRHLAERLDATTQARLAERDRAGVRLAALGAMLRGELAERHYHLVEAVSRPGNQTVEATLRCRPLRLADYRIEGAMVIHSTRGNDVVLWLPGQVRNLMLGFDDFSAAQVHLAGLLAQDNLRTGLLQRVGLLQRPLLGRLMARGETLEWTLAEPWPGKDLWQVRTAEHLTRLRETARHVLVPTAQADELARQRRIAQWEVAGAGVLGMAALFVPVLGEVLLVAAVGEMVADVYHGFEAWQDGRHRQAIEQWEQVLLSLAANTALVGVTSVVGSVTLAALDDWRVIELAAEQPRLWAADLEPYRVTVPEGVVVDDSGLLTDGTAHYLELGHHHYRVRQVSDQGHWQVEHPTDPRAYRPWLEQDGEGSWRLALHGVEDGTPDTRLTGLGGGLQQLDTRQLGQLRRLMPGDALGLEPLDDGGALRGRLGYWAARLAGRSMSTAPATPMGRRLAQDFPSLPARIVDDLVEELGHGPSQHRLRRDRVPLALAERARWSAHTFRIEQAVYGLIEGASLLGTSLDLALALIEQTARRPRGSLAIRLADGTPVAGGAHAVQVLVVPDAALELPDATQAMRLLDQLAAWLPAPYRHALALPAQARGDSLCRVLLERLPQSYRGREQLLGLPSPYATRGPARLGPGRLGYRLSGGHRLEAAHPSAVGQLRGLYPDLPRSEAAELVQVLAERGEPVSHFVRERKQALQQLEQALRVWEAEPAADPTLLERRRWCSNQLLRSWRRQSGRYRLQDGSRGFRLDLQDAALETLPRWMSLQGFEHVTELRLANLALHDLPEDFLSVFAGLRRLDLAGNELARLPRLGDALALEHLELADNRLTLTAVDLARLAAAPRLTTLNLAGNAVSQAPDLGQLPRLTTIILRNNALRRVPPGLGLRPHLQLVDLRDNLILDLPTELLELGDDRVRRVLLDGNPLSMASRERLQALHRRLGFAREWNGPRSSSPGLGARPWVDGLAPDDALPRLRLWNQLAAEDGSTALLRFLDDLTETSDFQRHGSWLQSRVWQMLEDCHDETAVRRVVFELAATPVTCADSVAEQFSQLELAVRVARAGHGDGSAADTASLMALARGLFRQEQLERHVRTEIARRRVAAPEQALDELEIGLAYRIGLADSLGLPAVPRSLLFERLAQVSDAQLVQAREAVLAQDNTTTWLAFLTERDFWEAHLRRRYPQRFADVHDEAAQRADVLFEQRQEQDSASYQAGMESIARDRDVAQAELIRGLTRIEAGIAPADS